MRDLRYALRIFTRNPGYAAVVIATLGLALGAITTLFSIADATFLAPLAVPDGDRVVHVFDRQPQFEGPANASWPELVDWRTRAKSLAAVAGERTQSVSYVGTGEPQHIVGALVTEDYLTVFGLRPLLGRGFTPDEHKKSGPPAVLLGNGFWQRTFGGDASVVGRSVQLSGQPFTVVGILPAGILEPTRGVRDVLIPMEPRLPGEARGDHYITVFGRLAPGASVASARAELDALGPVLDVDKGGHRIGLRSLRELLFGATRPGLLLLMGAALFVLIIAGANVTSIMLARIHGRAHELGVRAALGATRWRLARQLLTESLLLSLAGGAVGLLLAMWGKDFLLALGGNNGPRPEVVPLAWRTLLAATTAAAVVGAAVGTAPALRGSRADLATTLRAGTVPRSSRLRAALVVLQHAVAVMLLVGAGLLGKSLLHLLSVDPGFDPTNVVMLNVSMPQAKYPDDIHRRAFMEDVSERLRALPGVESASGITNVPFGSSNTSGSFEIEGREPFPADTRVHTTKIIVEGEYFRTMHIPILAGKTFAAGDHRRQVIINKTFADRMFPGESPIGHRIDVWGGMADVVAVVADVHLQGLDDKPELQGYVNLEQTVEWATFVARVNGDPTKMFAALKGQIWSVDPERPVFAIGTLDDAIAQSAAQRRIVALMVTAFAVVAMLLAAVGIYGVLSYSVSQRTREIGLRMALGARGRNVLALILSEGLRLSVIGMLLGLTGAILLAGVLGRFLYDVSATDPSIYIGVAAVLVLVGVAACAIPARRAARVEPMAALRAD